MKKNAMIAAVVMASGMGLGAAYPALAASDGNQASEAQAAMSAKVSMQDAIKAAESQTGGQAIEASFGNENGQTGYDITTVAKGGNEKSVFVDGTSGKVTVATGSDTEHENEGHENGGQ